MNYETAENYCKSKNSELAMKLSDSFFFDDNRYRFPETAESKELEIKHRIANVVDKFCIFSKLPVRMPCDA